MPSRASISLLQSLYLSYRFYIKYVSMPSRASISLLHLNEEGLTSNRSVSMPSRASISLLPHAGTFESPIVTVNVSMPSRASISLLPEANIGEAFKLDTGVNALTG